MGESMKRRSLRERRRLVLVAIAVLVIAGPTSFGVHTALTGDSSPAVAAAKARTPAATVVPIGKTGVKRIVLSPIAAKRLGITTARVASKLEDGKSRTVIPYAAVLYDANGDTWTYTSPRRLAFVRHDIRIDFIEGDLAVLAKGPRVGTAVVTVGSAELWGVEYGGIKED